MAFHFHSSFQYPTDWCINAIENRIGKRKNGTEMSRNGQESKAIIKMHFILELCANKAERRASERTDRQIKN